jgi:hypothetical protein
MRPLNRNGHHISRYWQTQKIHWFRLFVSSVVEVVVVVVVVVFNKQHFLKNTETCTKPQTMHFLNNFSISQEILIRQEGAVFSLREN